MPSSPPLARAAFDAWKAHARAGWVDAHLVSLMRFHGHADAEPALRRFAEVCADRIDGWARTTNRDENLPKLYRWDDVGARTEEVAHHPDHHAIGREVWGSGILQRYASPGREIETLGLLYLLAQNGEGGHCCPLACTAGMIRTLQASPDAPPEWLARLLDPAYDTRWHASQFLTEVQGGSDVGANAVVARPADGGWWEITGEKWFCSVIDAKLFLVTARPEGAPHGTAGVRAFAVPRELDGRPNGFEIRRLKYKLGTRSMASAEVDFRGARGWPVAEFRRVMDLVLNTSRLYNAICAAGILQRSWREADAYARTRQAFGQPILAFPTIARVVARLRTEAYAARATSFLLAATTERDDAWRMLVNLNKVWTALTCPAGVRDAIEVFGGNGAIEEFSVLPRLLRDSIVLEAWEGGHGVLCAQVLKDSRRGMHAPMFDWLERLGGHPRLAEVRARWERVVAHPHGEAHIRDVVEELRPVAQAIVLLAEARAPGSDPLLPVVAEHLVTVNARGWDPLGDEGLEARVAALTA